jgi:hypothetical protein
MPRGKSCRSSPGRHVQPQVRVDVSKQHIVKHGERAPLRGHSRHLGGSHLQEGAARRRNRRRSTSRGSPTRSSVAFEPWPAAATRFGRGRVPDRWPGRTGALLSDRRTLAMVRASGPWAGGAERRARLPERLSMSREPLGAPGHRCGDCAAAADGAGLSRAPAPRRTAPPSWNGSPRAMRPA